jgi:predicted DNA-binding protein
MISLRLDKDTENQLIRIASAKGVTKSAFLRQILLERLDEEKHAATPWELGKESFGRMGSGRSDLATNRKSILKEKIRAKNSGN